MKKRDTNQKKNTKSTLTHPETGREINIDAVIYQAVKSAILKSLKGSQGKTFTELADNVIKIIRKEMPDFKGSIPWYTISVLRDLETRNMVETFMEKRKKFSRLPSSSKKK
jgi:hypothetical protein